jgi:hypothetical protein
LHEAVEQIRDASVALRGLQRDWAKYAIIDAEGRAGNIDAARRILGGVAPQSGAAAIEVAKKTPLCAQPAAAATRLGGYASHPSIPLLTYYNIR